MKSRKTLWGPALLLAALLSIGAAVSCSDASGPKFPPPEDGEKTDTIPDQG